MLLRHPGARVSSGSCSPGQTLPFPGELPHSGFPRAITELLLPAVCSPCTQPGSWEHPWVLGAELWGLRDGWITPRGIPELLPNLPSPSELSQLCRMEPAAAQPAIPQTSSWLLSLCQALCSGECPIFCPAKTCSRDAHTFHPVFPHAHPSCSLHQSHLHPCCWLHLLSS